MRRYSFDRIPTNFDQGILKYLVGELQKLAAAINLNSELEQDVRGVAPGKPHTGQLAYADGVSWNPGQGEGTYEYTTSGWVKLAPASPSFTIATGKGLVLTKRLTLTGTQRVTISGTGRLRIT